MKIDFTIEKIQGSEAVLKEENGRTISWPIDLLPAGIKEGEKISFNVGAEENSAKDILNEILNAE